MSDFGVNANSDVYYSGHYWNDLDQVRRMLNEAVSGDPERTWVEHFGARVGRVFERALILNCGNGHVERGLYENGLIKEAVGIDYSDALLDQARAAASDARLPLSYVQMDTNTADFPEGPFDLVVNFAAGHHIARLDKVFRRLCELLPEDGWFVSWDYVGPHRNQYGYGAWDAAWTINRTLPDPLRQDMRYPHLPTMLATDPTEAIHSELILSTFDRYFTVDEEVPLGGALAYVLLTHNDVLHAASEDARADSVERILDADRAYCTTHPDDVLFAYFTGQPYKSILTDTALLDAWTCEEDEREAAAAATGEYYAHTALQDLQLELEHQRMATEHARLELAEVRAHLDHLVGSFPWQQARRLAALPAVAKLRSRPSVARLERRLRP